MKRKFKNIYFALRHGESWNQTKYRHIVAYSPKRYSPLTKKGRRQIEKLMKRIKNNSLPASLKKVRETDLIYSSPFLRTSQTARIITRAINKKIIFDKRLKDINHGIYNGKLKKEFYKEFPRPTDFPKSLIRFKKKPFKGENWHDVAKRMISVIKEIEKKYQKKIILIVGHGDPIWLLKGFFKGWNEEKLLRDRIKNGLIKTGELIRLN